MLHLRREPNPSSLTSGTALLSTNQTRMYRKASAQEGAKRGHVLRTTVPQ